MNTQKATIGRIITERKLPDEMNISLFPGYEDIATALIGGDFDMFSLAEKFGASKIAGMMNEGMYLISAEKGIEVLKREKLKRRIKEITQQALKDIGTENPREVASRLSIEALSLDSVHKKEKTDVKSMLKNLDEEITEIAEARLSGKKTIGIPTGFRIIDKNLSGLRKEHFIAISAYTSTGKTTLALNIINNILDKARVVLISLEMSQIDLMARLIAIDQDMPLDAVYEAGTNDSTYELYKKSKDVLLNSRLTIHTDKYNLDDILITMRAEEEREHVDVFVIDYIQNIIGSNGESEYEMITKASSQIFNMNKSLGSTVIVLSQISNESRKASELSINGKGSGAVRSVADMFLYLAYEEKDDSILLEKLNNNEIMDMVLVANKIRHGKVGAQRIARNPYSLKMYDRE